MFLQLEVWYVCKGLSIILMVY